MKTDNQNPSESPAPEIAPVVQQLVELQGKMTDKDFCREFNFQFHESTWSRIRRGVYAGDMEKAIAACEAMLRRVKERKALAAKVRKGKKFIEFTPHRTVLDRVGVLLEGPASNQNRLVMYLADSGGGKTALAREIAARHGGTIVEARESWRNNYFSALLEICSAMGVSDEAVERNPRAAETALIGAMRNRKSVLVIDEGEYFGPRSLNLIKLILNQTPTVVVLMAIPVLWTRVQSKAWVEAAQIMRRTDHVERLALVHPEEVQTFLQESGVNLNGSAEESSRIVARHANEFGRFDLISRVAERLADGEPHSSDEVETTVMSVKAMIGFTGGVR